MNENKEVESNGPIKFIDLKVGEKFRLVHLQAIVSKSSESALYTKIEDKSGKHINGEWVGRTNCTFIKKTG